MKTSLVGFLPLLLSVLASGALAEPTRLAEFDLYLDAPPDFVPATNFAGFQQIQTFSSIEVRELAVPFAEVVDALSSDKLALDGILVVDSTRFESAGRPALLLRLEQKISGIAFSKWQLIIGDELRSLSVTAACPLWAADTMGEPIKQSLLTAEWLRTPEEQLFQDLPFTLSETHDLKFARRTANMLVLADLKDTGALTGRSPSIVVGHLSSEEKIVDIESLSHRQLTALQGIDIVEILAEGETKIDGIRAYRIEAKARLPETETDVIFEQVMAFQQFKYLLTQSVVDETLTARYAPQFSKVRASIRFKSKR